MILWQPSRRLLKVVDIPNCEADVNAGGSALPQPVCACAPSQQQQLKVQTCDGDRNRSRLCEVIAEKAHDRW